MPYQIIKGTIVDHSSKEEFDDEGYPFILHKFNINGTSYVAKTPKNIRFQEGVTLIVSANDRNEIDSGIAKSKSFKWGPNVSALKSYITEGDQFDFMEGKLEKKRKIENRADEGADNWFTLELSNGKHFSVPERISNKIKKDDHLLIVFKNEQYVLIHNKTQQKQYGIAYPVFIFWIIFGIAIAIYLRQLLQQNKIDESGFYGGISVAGVVLFLFSIMNYFSYKGFKAAQRFLNEKLKNGN